MHVFTHRFKQKTQLARRHSKKYKFSCNTRINLEYENNFTSTLAKESRKIFEQNLEVVILNKKYLSFFLTFSFIDLEKFLKLFLLSTEFVSFLDLDSFLETRLD